MKSIFLIIHDVRSAHNVGSMLRSADGLGVKTVYLSGYTPYPTHKKDVRLPHLSRAIDKRISKTALGAEQFVKWQHADNLVDLISDLKRESVLVAALEQTPKAVDLTSFSSHKAVALIVGEEVKGLPKDILKICDLHLQIPMLGHKESFNVSVAAAMALFQLRYH